MAKSSIKARSILFVLAILALTAGCHLGGSSSSSSSSATSSAVTGVATPSSVAVVTANNAN
ncbi:MAG: hypothetical protein ACYC9J_07945 [Sulfuricaulis sp.]